MILYNYTNSTKVGIEDVEQEGEGELWEQGSYEVNDKWFALSAQSNKRLIKDHIQTIATTATYL